MDGDTVQILSVVMPFHDERATLQTALERLLETDLPVALDVVLVDDGSTDGSLESVGALLGDHRVSVARHEHRRGKGRAVRTGLTIAKGDLLIVLDADLEYDPEDVREVLRPLLKGDASVVYGTRALNRTTAFSFWYALGNKVTSFWASALFRTRLTDIHTCMKIAPIELWRSFELRCSGFDLDPEVTARILKSGHRIHEVPVTYAARSRAEGKKLRWTDGVKTLAVLTLVRLTRW